MEPLPEGNRNTNTSIRSALREFVALWKTIPGQVVLVFLVVAIAGILAQYYGSRFYFREQFYEAFSSDPDYLVYEHLYWFVATCIAFFVIPVLVVALVHRKPLREFALGLGDWRFGLKISVLFYVIMVPVVWFASASQEFQAVYPHAQLVKADWSLFYIYEAGLLVYFIGWEYVWRGYMLFGLKEYTGAGVAILMQMLPFVILHFGKPVPETIGAIIAAIALGALALRVRSFWYCVLIHWTVMLTIDVFSTLRFRAGIDGIGLDALSRMFAFLFS